MGGEVMNASRTVSQILLGATALSKAAGNGEVRLSRFK